MVTVITRTIGPSGRDYASFTLAEADVTNIGTSADLVANDEAIVFEADAGTYSELVTFNSTLTTDATRNVTYKPAAGSEHGGLSSAGVRLGTTPSSSNIHWVYDSHQQNIGIVALSRWYVRGVGCVQDGMRFSDNARSENYSGGSGVYTWKNCVFYNPGTGDLYIFAHSNPTTVNVYNCTFTGPGVAINSQAFTNPSYSLNLVNNLSLGNSAVFNHISGSSPTVTGSNNFGGSYLPFPIAVQGSVYPITPTTSFSTPLGSGDYAVYMGATGALANVTGNDVWQQGVGPSVNSDVPTTDINGVARSGATCNPGAFEADGFVAPTVLTRTIGSGKDYASFTLAEADVTNIGGSADLTFENEAIVFEADAGSYNESVTFLSTLTTDATRQVTYKPAAGSEHGGIADAGVLVDASGIAQGWNIYDAHVRMTGLSVRSSTSQACVTRGSSVGTVIQGCILDSTGSTAMQVVDDSGVLAENCVFYYYGAGLFQYVATGYASSAEAINCTFIRNAGATGFSIHIAAAGGAATTDVVNCLSLTVFSYYQVAHSGGTASVTGSNNFGGLSAAFPVALRGAPYPITATTSFSTPLGSGDYAVYMGATGALADVEGNDVWQHGIGPALNSDVPTTDINGVERSGTRCNPGAFEADGFVAPTVLTRTIGSGKDYASFTLAEADVTNIGGSADLTFENEAIVFEADAGTYAGGTQINSTLVTDPTRNVTYTVASGSEHGGNPASGVIIETSGSASTAGIWVYDSHTIFDGLVLKTTVGQDSKGWRFQDVTSISTIIRNCIFVGSSSGSAGSDAIYALYHGYSAIPTVVENCRLSGQCYFRTTSTDGNWRFINNTLIADPAQPTVEFRGITASIGTGTTITVDVTNNWGNCTRSFYSAGPGTVNLTGSNNYGEGTGVYDFPAAIRGTPYPITATTNTSPGAGDWAIYEAATGALVYDSDNDVLGQGIGPAGNSAVPTTDILGNTRSGAFCDPGAFEASPAIAKSPGGTLVGGYVPVGTYDVVPDSFPEAVEEAIPLYSSTSQALYAIRPIVSSETKAGNISTRTWTLQYRNASRSEYSRVLELYALSKGGAEGLYWNNQNFTRGGSTETVVVRMSQGPLKATRSTHGRYKFTVKLEEMRYAP